jgi:hypothetical protein
VIAQRNHGRADLFVGVGILQREALGDERHLGLRLLRGGTRLQPADGLIRAPGTIIVHSENGSHRDPKIGLGRETETGRHDADDRARSAVEASVAADHAGIAAE